MPAPDVSREPKVELIRAVWFTEAYSNGNKERFFLHLRHKEARDWSGLGPTVFNAKVFDALGRELTLWDKDGAGKTRFSSYSGWFNQGLFQLGDGADRQNRGDF